MGWFNFISREKEHSVTIESVSREFGMSKSAIVEILSHAGYDMYMPFCRLNNNQLEVILRAYIKALKSHYKLSSKNFQQFERSRQEQLKAFYSKFIRRGFFQHELTFEINGSIITEASNSRVFKENLDTELIRSYFFETIRKLEFEEVMRGYSINFNPIAIDAIENNHYTPCVHRELRWRSGIKHTFNDIKSRISIIIITGHYYIFTAEEDSFITFLTSLKRCFSAVNETLGEALNYKPSNLNPQCRTYETLSNV